MLGKNWLPDLEIVRACSQAGVWRVVLRPIISRTQLILRSEGKVKYLRLTRGIKSFCPFVWYASSAGRSG